MRRTGEAVANKALPKKVLVAVRPKDLHIVSASLGSEFNLAVCYTMEEARAHLDKNTGFIACGVRFDNGRMFDLLRAAKANPETRQIPFYLLLGEGTRYSKAILHGIKSAAKVLGSNGFTDLSKLENELGKAQAYERLREIIRQHLES